MIEVKEYLDESGKSPYAKWHNRLNARAAVKVSTALYRLEQGNFSNTKGIGGGMWGIAMVLTRNFRETIQARAKKDPAYREPMLTEAVDRSISRAKVFIGCWALPAILAHTIFLRFSVVYRIMKGWNSWLLPVIIQILVCVILLYKADPHPGSMEEQWTKDLIL
jgi:hypothetical protein